MSVDSRLRAELCAIVGRERVITERELLEPYSHDASSVCAFPEVVVKPRSVHEVAKILAVASRYGVPVTPRGMGTGLAGGAVPLYGGMVVSFEEMRRISIDGENLIATVEPGVVNAALKRAAARLGLWYPPDPASYETCSIGGNVATNAGGPACVKYGTTRDYVLGMEVVLPSGHTVTVGVKTRKGVVGYDLTRLLVGSEGTLALVTEVWLRLIARPPAVTTVVALFPSLSVAMKAVTAVLTKGFLPCAMEFLDDKCLSLVGDCIPFRTPSTVKALLLIELDGVPELISRDAEHIGELCMSCGAEDVYLAPDAYKRSALWAVRREVSLRIEHQAAVYIPEDVVVPIGSIASFVESLPQYEREFGFTIFTFGHAGDGNIHLNITAEGSLEKGNIEQGVRAILAHVVNAGGTISGEHGIGSAKRNFMPFELSAKVLSLQRQLKELFDPQGILNPGKLFPGDFPYRATEVSAQWTGSSS